MIRKELNAILENHRKWLADNPDGVCADLCGAALRGADLCGADLCGAILCHADLRGAILRHAILCDADLRGADLSGANIDYSCWPLWCGSLDAKIDKRLACQLLYHAIRAMQSVDDEEVRAVCNDPGNIALANQFHRADECGRIEPKSEETQEENK